MRIIFSFFFLHPVYLEGGKSQDFSSRNLHQCDLVSSPSLIFVFSRINQRCLDFTNPRFIAATKAVAFARPSPPVRASQTAADMRKPFTSASGETRLGYNINRITVYCCRPTAYPHVAKCSIFFFSLSRHAKSQSLVKYLIVLKPGLVAGVILLGIQIEQRSAIYVLGKNIKLCVVMRMNDEKQFWQPASYYCTTIGQFLC